MRCVCRECDGDGYINMPFIRMDFTGQENEDELNQLQADAQLAKKQAEELIKLNPASELSYQKQLASTLLKIEKQAEELIDDED